MPIFESIQLAEANAEKLRMEASEQAKLITERIRAEADAEILRLHGETDALVASILAAADKSAIADSERIRAEHVAADRDAGNIAAAKSDRALRSILKKVTGA